MHLGSTADVTSPQLNPLPVETFLRRRCARLSPSPNHFPISAQELSSPCETTAGDLCSRRHGRAASRVRCQKTSHGEAARNPTHTFPAPAPPLASAEHSRSRSVRGAFEEQEPNCAMGTTDPNRSIELNLAIPALNPHTSCHGQHARYTQQTEPIQAEGPPLNLPCRPILHAGGAPVGGQHGFRSGECREETIC
eukprot:645249-Rhodomonas_salina.2